MNRIFLFIVILAIIVGGALVGFWAVTLPGSVVINDSRGELVSLHSGVAAIALIVFGGLVRARLAARASRPAPARRTWRWPRACWRPRPAIPRMR